MKLLRLSYYAEWQSSVEMSVKSLLVFPVNERASTRVCHSALLYIIDNMVASRHYAKSRAYVFSFFRAPSVLVHRKCGVFSQAESLRKNTTRFTREVHLRTDVSSKTRMHKL